MLQSFLKSSFLKDFSLHIGIETKEEDEDVKAPPKKSFPVMALPLPVVGNQLLPLKVKYYFESDVSCNNWLLKLVSGGKN